MVAVLAAFVRIAPASGQWSGIVPSNQFELVDTIRLDEIDNTIAGQLERAQTLVAEHQWAEAIDILCQLTESPDGKLVSIVNRRYIGLREWCQIQLAGLPADALKLYRDRVDPLAQSWYEQGIAEHRRQLLQNVVDQALASSYGDKALLALGDIAFESGDFTAARWAWERILPNPAPTDALRKWPSFPDTHLDTAAIRARLVLTSIVESQRLPSQKEAHSLPSRAKSELAAFAKLHPNARGQLGGREGKYVDLLRSLLAESDSWPTMATSFDWPTLAGNPQRCRVAAPLDDLGSALWHFALRPEADVEQPITPPTLNENPREPLSYFPAFSGDTVFINDSQRVIAMNLATGKPAWGNAAVVYQGDLAGSVTSAAVPSETLGIPRFTLTVFQNRLYARMGSPITGQPQGASASVRPGYLICLDLAAEGRLLWKIEPEEGWAFEGSPIADPHGVYVAMRRQDIRPQAYVACLDTDTGRMRWRRFVCGAETPARGVYCECTHNLLTLCGNTIYYNTNLGAVAALSTDDGRPFWISLYPRARRGNLAELPFHWRRSLNPCVFHEGTLYVAPADSPRIFAFDAATGQTLWQTGTELEDAVHLLGVSGNRLIAGGRRLYWISLREEDRGHVKHVWPDSADKPGYGRGILAGNEVLWCTRDKLHAFDIQSAEPRKSFDLTAHGISGGNLLVTDDQLLIATDRELIAIAPRQVKPESSQESTTTPK